MSNGKATAEASATGGIGFVGVLIILGLLGLGPCADDCSGCGPTPESVYRSIECVPQPASSED
jgi:hypothetical protein